MAYPSLMDALPAAPARCARCQDRCPDWFLFGPANCMVYALDGKQRAEAALQEAWGGDGVAAAEGAVGRASAALHEARRHFDEEMLGAVPGAMPSGVFAEVIDCLVLMSAARLREREASAKRLAYVGDEFRAQLAAAAEPRGLSRLLGRVARAFRTPALRDRSSTPASSAPAEHRSPLRGQDVMTSQADAEQAKPPARPCTCRACRNRAEYHAAACRYAHAKVQHEDMQEGADDRFKAFFVEASTIELSKAARDLAQMREGCLHEGNEDFGSAPIDPLA